MAKKERLNEEATLNNNLGSSTLQENEDIKNAHEKSKASRERKKNTSN